MADRGTTTWDAALVDSTKASAAPRPLLGERYEIVGLLGVGGMGSVYRAFDRELEEHVALKVVQRSLVADPVTRERFRREVKLARRVTHSNVARVYDIGEHEGDLFLTMELVDGESLATRLAREVALAPARAVAVALAVCDGLAAAHAVGVVHLDLKPDNVMLGTNGRIVLTDFGIARLAGGAASRTLGVIAGTPQYMAPEQVDGMSALDGRADLYALGVMMYEMLTGEVPWKGDSAIAIAARRLVTAPPDLAEIAPVPEALAEVVRRCMARDPDARFRAAEEVRTALRACGEIAGDSALPLALRPTQPPPAPIAATPRNARAVAVMPVKNTGSPDDAHFAQTFGDALCDALATHPAMSVRAVSPGAGTDRDARALGRELGAEIVVTPSLRVTAEGDARAAIRVVSVAEGLQLWAGRLDRPLADLFGLVGDCADRIATALVVAAPTRAPAGPADGAIVALLARAHVEATSPAAGANDRAVALLEVAMSARDSDYWILSAYASALARRVEDGDGILEEALEAKAMARRAIALAPEAIEPRVALARVHLELGDADAAAAELHFRADTAHAPFQRTCGLLLADAGHLDAAISHLARAARLRDPRARWDEARARSLAGDAAAAEALLDADFGERTSEYFVTAARIALWRRDAARIGALAEALRTHPIPRREALLAYLRSSRDTIAAVHARLEEQARESSDLPRRRSLWFAMAAEAAAFAGDRERTLASLASAGASRLSDVAWLERCPLLDVVRDHPVFPPLVAAARARAVLAPRVAKIEEAVSA